MKKQNQPTPKTNFPTPTRPMEYVAIFVVGIPTDEGMAYLYLGYDPFLDNLMNLAIETERSLNSLFKSIYHLAEDPLFESNANGGFTLLLTEHEEDRERIDKMLDLIGGKTLYDAAFHKFLMDPVMEEMENIIRNTPPEN